MSDTLHQNGGLSPLQQALVGLRELRARLDAVEQARTEPIAIVGMGCRLPGGANDPESFWRLLREGVDAIREVPRDRWDVDAFYDPDPEKPGRMSSRWGGFLEQVDRFDPGFFGLSPREAAAMDPQQRLLLEVAWEALENAAIAPDSLVGSAAGVFVGVSTNDYPRLNGDPESIDTYASTGGSVSVVAGRLSYLLGLQGPSLVVDTACSSSLVALHLACGALRNGECRLALAGGVNLMLLPLTTIAISQLRMLAPDGRCKAFDAAADGFVRGEGCGVVVLKRLSDAQADGDPILAVVRGSAVNQDGRSGGLTAPNGPAQETVIRAALANAGVRPAEVAYIEAHGTGTSLGDPMELRALGSVLREGRATDRPALVGSVKTNLGHLEAAAGVAGLLKAILALKHGEIPPSLHFHTPSPFIPWNELPLTVPREATPWPGSGERRIAGVSSFGFSGTNAHVVLEAAPVPAVSPVAGIERPVHVLPLSAKSKSAIRELASRYAAHLSAHPEISLADLAHTGSVGRARFRVRAAVVAGGADEVRAGLAALASGETVPGLVRGEVAETPIRIAFLFSGQGSPWAGMGRELYETQPVFRAALDRCVALLAPHLDRSLLEVLASETLLADTTYAQPALFAVEWALAEMWRHFGVEPAAVLGHSVGEYVAATVAGVLSLEDALRLITARGRLMGALPRTGAMAAVLAPVERVEPLVAQYRDRVSIAAENAPEQTVISGERGAVEAILAALAREGVRSQMLPVSHAFHSPLLEPMLAEFGDIAGGVSYRVPQLDWISNRTAQPVRPGEIDGRYWVEHARRAVRFQEGMAALAALGVDTFLEVGPGSTLVGLGRKCLPDVPEEQWLTSLHRGREWESLAGAVARLFVTGVEIDWRGWDQSYARRRIELPPYPFQRERYWVATPAPAPARHGKELHPLLGRRVRSPLATRLYEAELGGNSPGYLSGHQVGGVAIFPAVAYLEQALAAGSTLPGDGPLEVVNLSLREALALPETGALPVQVTLAPDGNEGRFEVHSLPPAAGEDGEWRLHARGEVRRTAVIPPSAEGLEQIRARCVEVVEPDRLYQGMAVAGIEYGPAFRGLTELWRGEGEALGRIRAPEGLSLAGYRLHPALLDACLQIVAATAEDMAEEALYLPVAIQSFQVAAGAGTAHPELWSHVRFRSENPAEGDLTYDMTVFDPAGRTVAVLNGLELRLTNAAALRKSLGTESSTTWRDWLYQLEWCSLPADRGTSLPTSVEVAVALDGRAEALAEEHGRAAFLSVRNDLRALCSGYAVRALFDLNADLSPGRELRTGVLAAELDILPTHQQMLGRLLELLAEDGHLTLAPEEPHAWVVIAAPPDPGDLSARFCDLSDRYPEGAAELALLARCGTALASVLRGETDPLQLLFPGGSTADLERVYRDAPGSRVSNALVAEAIQQVVAGLGEHGRLRVLELGAGTGGTTAGVLPLLPPERTEYVFTDVSPVFPARAATTFAAYPFLRTRVLDVEQAPASQGFGGEQYDVVLAANVLHATADLRVTLGHVRELLAPGGLLVLVEGTERTAWVDLVFGLTPGWWRFQDQELRPEHPLLSVAQWQELLASEGFAEVQALGGEAADGFAPTVLLASLSAAPAARNTMGAWVVLADAGEIGPKVKSVLPGPAILVSPGTEYERAGDGSYAIRPEQPGDYDRLLAELSTEHGSLAGVAHLWSLETDAAADPVAAQSRGSRSLLYLTQALARLEGPAPALRVVTRGAQAVLEGEPVDAVPGALWGLARVIALEHPALRCRRIDLDPQEALSSEALARELTAEDREDQVALRGGERRCARLVSAASDAQGISSGNYHLVSERRGDLDALALEPIPRRAPGPGEVEIEVRATGLNFLDVMDALGILPFRRDFFGAECAGRISALGEGVTGLTVGDAVAAVALGGFSRYAITSADLVARLPAALSPARAATLPIAFLTARYAFRELAGLNAGERVLIHAAAGGVGLAAVQLARQLGAEIYATAGSEAKRKYLRSLGVRHVFDSRSPSFAAEVRAATHGEGVDVVLNSLAGEFIPAGLRLLRAGGRFLEMGKTDLWDQARAEAVQPGITYSVVALERVLAEEPERLGTMLREIVAECAGGALHPLPHRTFPVASVAEAFRYMAQARHTGKVVVTHPVNTEVRPDGAYLIVGGRGDLGLLTARWLVERGARHLTLLGRSTPTGKAQETIAALEAAGATITVERADVARREEVAAVLERLRAAGMPLRGVIHSAGVLEDGVLGSQTWERFETVLGPKMLGAWRLHELTLEDPLDLFVLYASTAGLLGSAGQGNHAAANAYLDALAHQRRAEGLPATTIDWGAWSEVGAAARLGLTGEMSRRGIGLIPPDEGLRALEEILARDLTHVAVVPLDRAALTGDVPPLFDELVRDTKRVAGGESGAHASAATAELAIRLQEAPPGERPELAREFVAAQAARILGLPESRLLNPRQPLNELGLDSLMAVELRNTLSTAVGQPLPATLLFNYPSVAALSAFLVEEALRGRESTGDRTGLNGAEAEESALWAEVEELSEDEAEATLLKELEHAGY